MNLRIISIIGAAAVLGGCATTSTEDAFTGVQATVAERTGHQAEWHRDASVEEAVSQRVREFLATGLTLESTVQIGLINSPELQARYEEIGISQADFMQAGVLSNPVFAATVRLPEANEGHNNLEFALAQSFLDVLVLPLRKTLAEKQFERTKLITTVEMLAFIAELKRAYYSFVAATQSAELFRTASEATGAASEFALRQYEAGNLSRLEQARETAFHADALLEAAQADLAVRLERENLNRLLGLWGDDTSWNLADPRLPTVAVPDIPIESTESYAIANRLEIAADVIDLETMVFGAKAARKWRWLGLINLSVSSERDTDGVYVTGPTLEVELPLFDRGEAKIARADAEVRAATQHLTAKAVSIRSEARAAREKYIAARDTVAYYERVILPVHETIVREAQLHHNAMIIGVYDLLMDKRSQIDAGRGYIDALRDYWLARTELEAACGGQLPGGSAPVASPVEGNTTPPITTPLSSTVHQH